MKSQAGAPVPVMFNEEGQAVIGIDTTDTAGRPSGKVIAMNGEDFRRSIYVQVRRTRPLGMLETFDAPSMMEANCNERPNTTVSPQSLLLMNNGSMREFAQTSPCACSTKRPMTSPNNLVARCDSASLASPANPKSWRASSSSRRRRNSTRRIPRHTNTLSAHRRRRTPIPRCSGSRHCVMC